MNAETRKKIVVLLDQLAELWSEVEKERGPGGETDRLNRYRLEPDYGKFKLVVEYIRK